MHYNPHLCHIDKSLHNDENSETWAFRDQVFGNNPYNAFNSATYNNYTANGYGNPDRYANNGNGNWSQISQLDIRTVEFMYNKLSSSFNAQFYLDYYSDLKNAFGNNHQAAWNHWNEYGMSEGRRPSWNFDVHYYLNKYPDLRNAFGNNYRAAYEHWVNWGINEGREAVNPKSGIFKFKSGGDASTSYLNVHGNQYQNEGTVNLWVEDSDISHQWYWNEADNTIRTFHNPGFCLNLPYNSSFNQARIEIYSCNGHDSQKWLVDGNKIRKKSNPNFCLNIPYNNRYSGAVVELYGCNNHESQRFTKEVDSGWKAIAREGESFTLKFDAYLIYGAYDKFSRRYGRAGETVTFNNATFGDPLPGVVKNGFGYFPKYYNGKDTN